MCDLSLKRVRFSFSLGTSERVMRERLKPALEISILQPAHVMCRCILTKGNHVTWNSLIGGWLGSVETLCGNSVSANKLFRSVLCVHVEIAWGLSQSLWSAGSIHARKEGCTCLAATSCPHLPLQPWLNTALYNGHFILALLCAVVILLYSSDCQDSLNSIWLIIYI